MISIVPRGSALLEYKFLFHYFPEEVTAPDYPASTLHLYQEYGPWHARSAFIDPPDAEAEDYWRFWKYKIKQSEEFGESTNSRFIEDTFRRVEERNVQA